MHIEVNESIFFSIKIKNIISKSHHYECLDFVYLKDLNLDGINLTNTKIQDSSLVGLDDEDYHKITKQII